MSMELRENLIKKARRLIIRMIAADTDKAFETMSLSALQIYVNVLEQAAVDRDGAGSGVGNGAGAVGSTAPSSAAEIGTKTVNVARQGTIISPPGSASPNGGKQRAVEQAKASPSEHRW